MKLLPFLLLLAGCTTVFENGRPVFRTSSNIAGLHYQSPAGSMLDAQSIDNAAVHRAAWAGASKLSGAIGAAAGGTLFLK